MTLASCIVVGGDFTKGGQVEGLTSSFLNHSGKSNSFDAVNIFLRIDFKK